jgi:hypothetical protein
LQLCLDTGEGNSQDNSQDGDNPSDPGNPSDQNDGDNSFDLEDPLEDCHKGVLSGVWKRINSRGGVFAGRWIDEDGLPTGRLAGIWGLRSDGERVFYGVYSNANGRFLGLLKGKYKPLDLQNDSSRLGCVFAGHWESQEGELSGILKGSAGPGAAGDDDTGVFRGVYASADCFDENTLDGMRLPDSSDCLEDGTCYSQEDDTSQDNTCDPEDDACDSAGGP